MRVLLRHSSLWPAMAIASVFVLAMSVAAAWTREHVAPPVAWVMKETILARAPFSVGDDAATEKDREVARQVQPRVFIANQATLDQIEAELLNLPKSLEEAQTVEAVAPEIRERFGLDERTLDALHARATDERLAEAWRVAVRELMDILRSRPIITPEALQQQMLALADTVELRGATGPARRVNQSSAVSTTGERLIEEMERAVRRAGFGPDAAPAVAARLTRNPQPTYTFDEAATNELRNAAAAAVPARMITYQPGDVLVRRGDVLDAGRRTLLLRERSAFLSAAPPMALWGSRAGLAIAVAMIAGGIVVYLGFIDRRLARDVRRIAAVAISIGLATLVACAGAVGYPALLTLFGVAPTVLLAMTIAIAFDRRAALAVATLQALLVSVALDQSAGFVLVALTGVGLAAWRLKEVRSRTAPVFAGLSGGIGMLVASVASGLFERPMGPGAMQDLVVNAAQAGLGGVMVGFLTLGLMPAIERAFGVVTAMTLIELRDPRHPLLRELAQRAPGTYTHSMAVASIAEAAAEAIGGNGLHVYAGALYHDVGKMIKPEYFVENQSGGINPHERLSPAMSLLVIVGHVKDGMELAREHGLPSSIRHYIESHHGTTLVEYFYDRARKQGDGNEPFEFGYRYPGPRPRTREAAVLMLSDAVESTARTLAEPTPSRIEALVRSMASKRLNDGQFDECDLTLKELNLIEQSIVKSLNSIYHARIAYPGQGEAKERKAPAPAPGVGAAG